MKHTYNKMLTSGLVVTCLSLPAYAKVSAERAQQLGQSLTPVGAEKAGNKDGTIPEWTGGILSAPADYTVGEFHPDPYKDDKPLFTITAGNVGQYKSKLAEGYVKMFETYPTDYVMHVYPTRRSASFPKSVYDATIKNATTAELIKDGDAITNAIRGFPFPIPNNAAEIMWNFQLAYAGEESFSYWVNANPATDGSFELTVIEENAENTFYLPHATLDTLENTYKRILHRYTAPVSKAGFMILAYSHLDTSETPQSAWTYSQQQRRVRRAPSLVYDNPSSLSAGLRTSDQGNIFNGSLDRYDWEILRKAEMYVPYNAYRLHSGDLKPEDILKPGHANQDLARYELHRVWLIDATLKPGASHIYPKRSYQVDEDSWQLMTADHYREDGSYWRFSENHVVNYYEMPLVAPTFQAHHDLDAKRYNAAGLDNYLSPTDFSVRVGEKFYDLGSMRIHAARR